MMNSSGQVTSRKSFTDFLAHIHPPTVPEETVRFRLSWGLGGMCATLLFLLFVTGILQLLSYEPSVSGAYSSIQAMYSQVPLSGWIRNIHHWSANLLVIVSVLHLLRVYLTGAIGPGRRLNWIIGVVLLFLTLAANFSGYLLPWDQLAYWAVTICTSMMAYVPGIGPWFLEIFRGGVEVGSATLTNFYGLHIALIPGSLLLFMIWHFWLVRKSGGLIRVKKRSKRETIRIPAAPDLIIREAAVGLGLIAVIMLMAVFWDAPLYEQANPGMSPNPAKAPWYFLGFQELLLHLHPVFAVCVVPVLFSAVFITLPFWKESVLPGGIWFGGKKGRGLALVAFAVGIALTFLVIILDEKLLRTGQSTDPTTGILTREYLPLLVYLSILAGGYQVLFRRFKFSRAEALMAGVMVSFAVLVALTIIGIWFRGPGMQLIWL